MESNVESSNNLDDKYQHLIPKDAGVRQSLETSNLLGYSMYGEDSNPQAQKRSPSRGSKGSRGTKTGLERKLDLEGGEE